jgi:hypothetical protein
MPTDGVVIGRTTRTTISRRDNSCGLAVGPSPQPQASAVWTVEVTPLQVYASAVTFQVKWARTRGDGRDSSPASGDLRITLRPGGSLPLDIMPIQGATTMPAAACDLTAMTLRVAAGFWPRTEDDGRLLNAELWLVERLQDGSERSQALTLRTGINQPTPFYFEPVVVSTVPSQLFGSVTLTPVGNTYSLTLDARYRLAQPVAPATQTAGDLTSRFEALRRLLELAPTGRVESSTTLTPGEVVEVQLPRLRVPLLVPGNLAPAQTFSIRIRARELKNEK